MHFSHSRYIPRIECSLSPVCQVGHHEPYKHARGCIWGIIKRVRYSAGTTHKLGLSNGENPVDWSKPAGSRPIVKKNDWALLFFSTIRMNGQSGRQNTVRIPAHAAVYFPLSFPLHRWLGWARLLTIEVSGEHDGVVVKGGGRPLPKRRSLAFPCLAKRPNKKKTKKMRVWR